MVNKSETNRIIFVWLIVLLLVVLLTALYCTPANAAGSPESGKKQAQKSILQSETTFDPYSPDVRPPGTYDGKTINLWTANVFPAGSTINRLYCPAHTDRGYKPDAFFPASLFPQDVKIGASGAWTLDNDEWYYVGTDWMTMFERLNGKQIADSKLLAPFNGLCFPTPCQRFRTVIFPSSGIANDLYFNPVNVYQVKFRVVAGVAQWYGYVQTMNYGTTNPNNITIANTPSYLMQHQTDCNSLGGFITSRDDWGVNTFIPLVSRKEVVVPLAMMTYRGATAPDTNPPPVTPPPSAQPYTITTSSYTVNGHSAIIHVVDVPDITKIRFFVSSSRVLGVNPTYNRVVVAPVTPQKVLEDNNLLVSWNADGFRTRPYNDQYGYTVEPLGTWASLGKTIQKNTIEDTLYANASQIISFWPRPTTLWNAASFSNTLVNNGSINTNLENTSIAARTAVGWNGTHIMVVVADGIDGSVGLRKPELANWFINNSMKYAINNDGGSSSSLSDHALGVVSGNNGSGQQRPVVNIEGIY